MTDIHGRVWRARTPAPSGRGSWPPQAVTELRALWDIHGGKVNRIAKAMRRTRGSIQGKARVLSLQFHTGSGRVLAPNDAAMTAMVSKFPNRVMAPVGNVLKSGDNQRKLGKVVTKGAWKGMPLFSLTLEERATCPLDCKLIAGCYGNNMGMAKRYRHGQALMEQIVLDLSVLSTRYPRGYVVRTHILGDYFSPDYVAFWDWMLDLHPALRVFGYTAWQAHTPIGAAVAKLRDERWDRFAVRTSGAPSGPRTIVVATEADKPAGAIICPAQRPSKKAITCSSCALCFAPAARERVVAFLAH